MPNKICGLPAVIEPKRLICNLVISEHMNKQLSAIENFRRLHDSGCFVLPNPWDAGSAVYLEHLGFKGLATTSAGFAFSRGLPDGTVAVSLEMMLEHFREIAAATSLPVNADFQNGYADDPESVALNVKRCIETGVAGLTIEDSTGKNETPLYDFDLAVERIKAARAAIGSVPPTSGSPSEPPAVAGGPVPVPPASAGSKSPSSPLLP